ncbi:TIGR00730 family Rossman fold protein [Streptomyces sp. NPDC056653]|uniref:LOG family protein n=1 Tax=Streptomyces sp. NPDC056653 TaxID=3345894 RepID=UPI00369DA79A
MTVITETGPNIAVFCGARPGVHPDHLAFAHAFGRELALRGSGLVYGAGGVGVMGAVAQGVSDGGGAITGVVPSALRERERSDDPLGTIHVVATMHERKALMYRLATGFAVLPGGIGTLDEVMEVLTWNQLGLMAKPVVVVNHEGFFDPLLNLLDHLVTQGFLARHERALIQTADAADDACDRLCLRAPVVAAA